MPNQVKPPMSLAGAVLIRFQILSNGRLKDGSMTLEERAGIVALDRAAWYAIVQSNYPPLPAGYKGGPLDLRIRFRYNGGAPRAPQGNQPRPAALTLAYPDEQAK